MKISIIVAHGKNREIGYENKLLWNVPEDFKQFKEKTSGHINIMGRNTFESIGKPLPNRINIVISKNFKTDFNVIVYNNILDAIDYARDAGETELFIIGGENIYRQTLNLCTDLYISEIDFSGTADTYFPEITDDWIIEDEIYHKEIQENDRVIPSWKLKHYRRKYS